MTTNIHQAITLHQEGKLEEAETKYREILKTQSENTIINHNLGVLLCLKGKFDEAIVKFKKTIELKPDYLEAYYNLATVLNNIGRLVEAEKNYKKVLKLKPDYFEAHNNLGNISLKIGKFIQAERFYKKAIDLRPDNVEVYNNLGLTFSKLNKLENAIVSFKKIIELKPDYVQAYDNLGIILEKIGRPEEASLNFRKSIVLEADFINLVNCVNIGDWQNSKNLLTKICINKTNYTKHYIDEFIKIWCLQCSKLVKKSDIKKFSQIFAKLYLITERNNHLSSLIKLIYENVDINTVIQLVKPNEKILIKVSYCQYQFEKEDFLLSEELAAKNIQDAISFIQNDKTKDFGWLIVRRSLVFCKNKSFARKTLDNLIVNLVN